MLCHHRDQVPKSPAFSGFGQRRDVSGALLTARPPREDGPRRRLGLDAVMQAPPGSVMLVPEPGFCYKGQRDRWIEVRVRVRASRGPLFSRPSPLRPTSASTFLAPPYLSRQAGGKVFVNVCSHPRVDPVCGANLERVPRTSLHVGPRKHACPAARWPDAGDDGRGRTRRDGGGRAVSPTVLHLALTGVRASRASTTATTSWTSRRRTSRKITASCSRPGAEAARERQVQGSQRREQGQHARVPVFNPDAPPMEAAGKAASEAPTMRSGPLMEEVGGGKRQAGTTEAADRSTTAAKRPIKKGFLFPSGGTGEGKGAARGWSCTDGSAEEYRNRGSILIVGTPPGERSE